MQLLFPLLLVLALYFFVMPQRRRQQAQRAAAKSFGVGDRVVTAGGMIGTLHHIDSKRGVVEIAPGVFIEVLAQAILRPVDPAQDGTDGDEVVEEEGEAAAAEAPEDTTDSALEDHTGDKPGDQTTDQTTIDEAPHDETSNGTDRSEPATIDEPAGLGDGSGPGPDLS